MAKEDMDQDEDMDSMENMLNEGHKSHKEHKVHSHNVHHSAHKHHSHEKSESCCGGKTAWIVSSIILFIAAVIFMILWMTKGTEGVVQEKTLTADQIKVEMGKFVNENLIQAGTTATIESVKDVGEAYELVVQYMGQNITSYASKDGKMFYPSGATVDGKLYFPNAYIVEDLTVYTKSQQTAAPQAPQDTQTNVPKSEKPNVEVFVMSHCPYGTQIEKGLLPVVELLGGKADIQIKFVNYAMHGQEEIDEQLNQYCIQQEYPDQFYKYLQCFLADGNTERCIGELEFSQTKLDACVDATDKEFGISEAYEDKSTWRGSFPSFSIHDAENTKYGVQGSPTLVINGVQASSSRDSESLKKAICNAFTTVPDECNTVLSTAGPSAGFGFGTSGTDAAAAGCGV